MSLFSATSEYPVSLGPIISSASPCVSCISNKHQCIPYHESSSVTDISLCSQLITIKVLDDTLPELGEDFEVVLSRVASADGVEGSTPTSGASIDPAASINNISLPQSDHPYGLLQFSTLDTPPDDGDPPVPPATEQPQVVYNTTHSYIMLTYASLKLWKHACDWSFNCRKLQF